MPVTSTPAIMPKTAPTRLTSDKSNPTEAPACGNICWISAKGTPILAN